MASTTHAASNWGEFSQAYLAIVSSFEQICTFDGHGQGIHMDVRSALADQRGRFRVWAENLGAHPTGKASLHDRLREAPHIRSYLHELLQNLQELLTEALALLLHGPPQDLEDFSDSNSDSDTPENPPTSAIRRESLSSSADSTDIDYVCADILHGVNALYGVSSMLIQSAVSPEKIGKYAKFQVSQFTHEESQRLKDKYPYLANNQRDAELSLLGRLVQANLRRRQIFASWHHNKIATPDIQESRSREPEPIQQQETIPVISTRTESDLDALLEVKVPPQSPPTSEYSDSDSEIWDETAEILSVALHVPDELRRNYCIPPRPMPSDPSASGKAYIECPYCFKVVRVSSEHRWENHVLHDLRPFICTFEKCSQPDRLFRTQNEWYQHELQYHRREWVCRITSCGAIFRDLHNFPLHLKTNHSKMPDDLVLDQCERETTILEDQCPFCAVAIPMDKMSTHVGNHLIDCALFALPRAAVDTEDDSSLQVAQPSNNSEMSCSEDQDTFSRWLGLVPHREGRPFGTVLETEKTTILNWFSTIPYRSHHAFAREGRVQGTGHWLFKTKEFTTWQQSKKSEVLWLHGIPGAGKTKLVSATIDYLPQICDKVAFFYCSQAEENRRDKQEILRCLIEQLACPTSGSAIHKTALEAYKKGQEVQGAGSQDQLSAESSLTALLDLLECYEHPALVVDGLDECLTRDSRDFILADLLSVLHRSRGPIKLLISSRLIPSIGDMLRALPHVCIEARSNGEDMEGYIKDELSLRIQDKQLLNGEVSPELSQLIQATLTNDANRLFLWVHWQLRALCTRRSESDVRARLGALPKGLHDVYDEVLDWVKSQQGSSTQLATLALKWMLVSQRPLKPQELVTAVGFDLTTSTELPPQKKRKLDLPKPLKGTPAPHGQQQSSVDADIVIYSCGGLILWDKTLDVIRFSHQSVQEYLEMNNILPWNPIDAQLLVAECCLWTLQNPQRTPLYHYAALNWFRHCRSYQDLALQHAGTEKSPKLTLHIPLLKSFLGSFGKPGTSYLMWLDWLSTSEDINNREKKIAAVLRSQPVRPIFAAAFAGLGELVRWLWHSKDVDMNVTNCEETPLLHLACQYGTRWIVDTLLTQRASISRYNKLHLHTTLQVAAYYGRPDVVSLLLDRGAVIDVVTGYYGTALCAAAYSGNIELVLLLLDRGAYVNAIAGGHYGTALCAAASGSKMEVASLLLERGADVNIDAGHYGTALCAAAYSGNIELVLLLLGRGAYVNAIAGGYYGTAMCAAAYGGKLEVASLLLDRGADINVVSGGDYGTALCAAAHGGKPEVVSLLLDRGADVNAVAGGLYGTALCAAASGGKMEVVSLLMGRGADVNAVAGSHYGTALCAAAFICNIELVSLLLDRGADVNAVAGGLYGTALCATAYGGNIEVVSLLLDRGADVNAFVIYYGTALCAAAFIGNTEVASLLLDRGADVNAVAGGDYGTALCAAAYGGNIKVVSLLLDRGADVNTVGGFYGTALGVAAYWGSLDVVSLLLDRGAAPDVTNSVDMNPCTLAREMGHQSIVKLLDSKKAGGLGPDYQLQHFRSQNLYLHSPFQTSNKPSRPGYESITSSYSSGITKCHVSSTMKSYNLPIVSSRWHSPAATSISNTYRVSPGKAHLLEPGEGLPGEDLPRAYSSQHSQDTH